MEFDDIVKGRRSIWQYSQKEVPRELLEEILESCGFVGPILSHCNEQGGEGILWVAFVRN
jgi:hypothetical protein